MRFQSSIALMRPKGFSVDDDSEESKRSKTNMQNSKPEMQSPHTINNTDRSVASCLICFDKTPDAVFMECGHGGKL